MQNQLQAGAGDARSLLGGRYTTVVASAFLASVVFTVTDFVTSFIALGEGFDEGNSLLIGLSGLLNLDTIDSLLVVKLAFVTGIAVLAVVGTRSRDRTTRKMILGCLAMFVVLLGAVSLNNLYWIAG